MFDEIDLAFYQRRAKEERVRAAASSDIRTHMEMALEYERRMVNIALPAEALLRRAEASSMAGTG